MLLNHISCYISNYSLCCLYHLSCKNWLKVTIELSFQCILRTMCQTARHELMLNLHSYKQENTNSTLSTAQKYHANYLATILHKQRQLENVAIANALQLEAARCHAVPIRLHFVAHAKFELALPIRCRLKSVFTAYTFIPS